MSVRHIRDTAVALCAVGLLNACSDAAKSASTTDQFDSNKNKITADVTAPVVTLAAPLGAAYFNNTVLIRWNTLDENPDQVRILLSTDSGGSYDTTIAEVADTGTYTWNTNSVAEGERYRLRVIAIDRNNNESVATDSPVDFGIDRTPPNLTLSTPTGGEAIRGTTTVSWTIQEPHEQSVEFWLSADSGATFDTLFTRTAQERTYTWATNALPDGASYQLKVVAVDQAGNRSAPAISADFVLDNTPATPSTNPLRFSAITPDSMTVAWDPASDALTAPNNLKYKLFYSLTNNINNVAVIEANGNAVGNWLVGTTNVNVPGLMSGQRYYWNVLIKDDAHNRSIYQQIAQATLAAGNLDSEFNGSGYSIYDGGAASGGNDEGKAIVIDGDGKIIVAGNSYNGSNADMALWRYRSDGTLDTTFGQGGVAVHDNAAGGQGNDFAEDVAIDSNGRIVAVGRSYDGGDDHLVVWRFTADGQLDTTFNGSGYLLLSGTIVGNPSVGTAVALDANDRIVVAGKRMNTADDDLLVGRLNNDGTLDETFNQSGIFILDSAAGGSTVDAAEAIFVDRTGKVLAAGQSHDGINFVMALWRFNPDGTLDSTFGNSGKVTHSGPATLTGNTFAHAVRLDRNDKIVVAGHIYDLTNLQDMVTWRFNDDGSLDTSFAGTGYVSHHSAAGGNAHDMGNDVQIDNADNVVVAGWSQNNINMDAVLWRYTNQGQLDSSFGNNGILIVPFPGGGDADDLFHAVAIDANGRINVAGDIYNTPDLTDMIVARVR